MIMRGFAAELAKDLWLFQFGVAAPGSVQLLAHGAQAALCRCLPGSSEEVAALRAFAQLDMVSMLSERSCNVCKHELEADFLGIAPAFDLLRFCGSATRRQKPDSSRAPLLQKEGACTRLWPEHAACLQST